MPFLSYLSIWCDYLFRERILLSINKFNNKGERCHSTLTQLGVVDLDPWLASLQRHHRRDFKIHRSRRRCHHSFFDGSHFYYLHISRPHHHLLQSQVLPRSLLLSSHPRTLLRSSFLLRGQMATHNNQSILFGTHCFSGQNLMIHAPHPFFLRIGIRQCQTEGQPLSLVLLVHWSSGSSGFDLKWG